MSDMAHSVAQRLLNFGKANNEEYNFILARYGVERLLYRISQSPIGQKFVLKGASLFLVWFGHTFRTTRDVDLLGVGSSDLETIANLFHELCKVDTQGVDGLVFQPETVRVSRIKGDQDYEGVRVLLRALLGKARIDLQVDVGFGDAITPEAERVQFPTLLDGPAPSLLAYPPYTAIAEKFQAMVGLDMANSRMKDFYDICVLFRSLALDAGILATAVQRTFARRNMALPGKMPTALTRSFSDDPMKRAQWNAFVKKSRLTLPMGELPEVVEELRMRFEPMMHILESGRG